MQTFNSKARVKIAEITPLDVGDLLQVGDVLYRTVAADNQIEHVTFSVAVPAEIAPFLSKDIPVSLLMENSQRALCRKCRLILSVRAVAMMIMR